MADTNIDFTQEELVILGEVEPQKETLEDPGNPESESEGKQEETTDEDQKTDEDEKPEHLAETDGNVDLSGSGGNDDVPGKRDSNAEARIKELTWEKESTKRELELIKTLGVDKYYELNPDKAPEGYKPLQGKEQATPDQSPGTIQDTSPASAAKLLVNSGEYEGKTLEEVKEIDPIAAADLYINWKMEIERSNEKVRADQAKQSDLEVEEAKQAERDIDTFKETLAKNHYGKEAVSNLSSEELNGVESALSQVLEFIKDPKNGTTNLMVAYRNVFHEKIIRDALKSGAKGLGDKLKQGPTKTVHGGAGDRPAGNRWESFEQMSENQMVNNMNGMSEKNYASFIKEAPQSLKDKFPSVDWDPI